VILELRPGSGRSNGGGQSASGIPGEGRGEKDENGKPVTNEGKNIKSWKAGRGSV
jgi:hypothetical protein